MRKLLSTALAFALTLTTAQTARAWDPDPLRGPNSYTTVARFLDIGYDTNLIYLAFTDDPKAFCLAQGGNSSVPPTFGDAWIPLNPNLGETAISRWLSTLMWAKSQNFQVRLFMDVPRGNTCYLTGIRTCTDQAACAYPPPAGP